MSISQFTSREDFARARSKGRMQQLLSTLQWKNNELLSFYEVTKLIKPKLETYRGLMAIPLEKVIGSEGRYHDFTLAFFPRKEMLRSRWQSIDEAHLHQVILPPISVYKLGDSYFVRDGNHRVSVAKAQGVEFIDAEVVELDSEIPLEPGMTRMQLVKRVVSYERQRFLDEYQLDRFMDMDLVKFSSPGMYPEIVNHIQVHKYFINQDRKDEIPFDDAARSWYMHVFLPIVMQIREDRLLRTFPGKTYGDLYLWIVRHWDFLKQGVEQDVTIEKASKDFKIRFGKGWFKRWREWMAQRFSRS
ncbi:MAG: transcriptional regulator [Sphaerochaetaceae bacterium]|nr:transcriptional regulator [Sphaerochaetaceae bacterium]MDD3942213.1 transcriptional regulator [Sphaerochaetaceae bacterium]MDX9940094.1 transcriptional regulator [Sphaerochaetaceae bacterium]